MVVTLMGATCGVSVVCAWMVAMWSHPSLAQGEPKPTFKPFLGCENCEEAGRVAPKGALKGIEE